MEDMGNTQKILLKKVKPQHHSEDLHTDRRIILKWILRKYSVRVQTIFIWLRIGIM
jgi:hypothetical protein